MIKRDYRFGVLQKKGTVVVKEAKLPCLASDEVLIRQEACNICTTDYQQWQGKREHQGYPMAGGHECSGVIEAVGKDVGDTFEVGDRVSILYDYCGFCENCKNGKITSCQNKKQFGKNYSTDYYGIFGFADYFVRKAKSVLRVSGDLSASEAGFVEPLSSVLKGLRKLKLSPGLDTVVVIGTGTMGLLNALAVQAMGVKVIVSGTNRKKNAKAKSMGLEVIDAKECNPVQKVKELTHGKGVSAVILAVGSPKANQQALEMVKDNEGKILYFSAGYPAPSIEIDSNLLHYKEYELIGTYGSDLIDFTHAAQLLSEKRIDVSPLIEEKIPLSTIQSAFEKASERGSFRVSVMLQE